MEPTLVFCPRCGAATTPTVCSNCGYVFEKEEDIINEEQSEESKKEKGEYGWIVGLIITLLFLIFLFIVVLGIGGIVAYTFYSAQQTTTPNVTIVPNNQTIEDEEKDESDIDDLINNNQDEDEEDNNDETEEVLGVRPYSDLVYNYDMDELQEYLDNANEYNESVTNNKNDVFKTDNYYSYTGSNHNGYDRDEFPTPYFEVIQDSIVPARDYSLERYVVKYESEVNGILVNSYSSYYQVISDTKDFTDVNNELREKSLQILNNYIQDYSQNSTDYSYDLFTDAFVTFNNDEIISVVYDVTTYDENNYLDEILLFSVNIDVKNCEVMDNTKIIDADDSFVGFFKDRCECQMGYTDYVNGRTNDEIKAFFNSKDSVVIYFTPLGIEVGYQYLNTSSKGWITCTINDFATFLTDEYDFDTSFGKNYDVFEYERKYGTHDGNISDYDYINGGSDYSDL